MKQIYQITGMTCGGCSATVTTRLSRLDGVNQVEVDLEKAQATIQMELPVSLDVLRSALPEKYNILEQAEHGDKTPPSIGEKTKLQQLRPLFLIFLYLGVSVFLLNYKEGNMQAAMLDFMGLFFVVFSFFKFLDLKGFPESFRMYDPLAKAIPLYGHVYPFLELALGLMFLMRYTINVALGATIVLLGITTIGVTMTLLNKEQIQCACLGTALKLPMTEATFIENAIMLVMALVLIVQNI